MELEKLSGIEIGKLVNSRQVSAVESLKYFQKRIEKYNPVINAFTYTQFDDALEIARIQDKRIADGEYVGPLAGVPVGLKDFLDSKPGWTNSHGGVEALIRTDKFYSQFCRAAEHIGAIPVGKTNAPAFGFSGACQNKLYGATSNPFDPSRTSGGSSGGSAAAVAAGLLPISESGDAGGSTRNPANWCNLVGFKASLGTIPSMCRPDGWAATHPYCFNGCVTKTVEDSALMLRHMAWYNPFDPISLPINADKDFVNLLQNPEKPLNKMKIAYTSDFGLFKHVDPEIVDIVESTAYRLEEAGARVTPVTFNFQHSLEEIMYCWAWAISIDTALDLDAWKKKKLDLVKDYRDQLPEEFIMFNEIAAKADIWDMRKFNEIRTDILDNFQKVLLRYDAIISPVSICKPMPNAWGGKCVEVCGEKLDPSLNFISFCMTPFANFIGYPAVSVPAGMTNDNLPVGMQIIGRQYRDSDVLTLAKGVEDIQPWRDNYDLINLD